MKKINLILLIAAIIVVLGVIIYMAYGSYTANAPYMSDAPDAVVLTPEEEQEIAEIKAAVSEDKKAARYTHPTLGFSFDKPEGYSVGAIPGGDGSQTLIVQRDPSYKPNTANKAYAAYDGFQIVITPLDESIELTPTLIKEQIPGISINNAQKIVLDGKGNGLMFSSNNDAFGGKSFEIWFVTQTHLYQITSYSIFASELQTIIGTWRFN